MALKTKNTGRRPQAGDRRSRAVPAAEDNIPWRTLELLSRGFETRLEKLSPIECATVTVLGNVLLRFSAPAAFSEITDDPKVVRREPELYRNIISGILASVRPEILEAAGTMSGNARRYSICHLCALDFTLLVIAGGFRSSILERLRTQWASMKRRASPAQAACTFIRAFERARNVRAIPNKPDGTPYLDQDLRQMLFLPGFCTSSGPAREA